MYLRDFCCWWCSLLMDTRWLLMLSHVTADMTGFCACFHTITVKKKEKNYAKNWYCIMSQFSFQTEKSIDHPKMLNNLSIRLFAYRSISAWKKDILLFFFVIYFFSFSSSFTFHSRQLPAVSSLPNISNFETHRLLNFVCLS